MTKMQKHLDEDTWRDVITALETLLPYYERTNLVNTLFLLPLWRRELSNNVKPEEEILEIGSGSGGPAKLLKANRILCLDPSYLMLRFARNRLNGKNYEFVEGIAENLPFASDSFHKIFCSFSFRDFMDKRSALKEIIRLLIPGGSVHIVELLRPNEKWRQKLMDTWIEKAVPAIAKVLVPDKVSRQWKTNPYVHFARTYRMMSPIGEYVSMAKEVGFKEINLKFLGMKSIFILQGVKPRTM